jgi:hypothetical protein
MISDFNATGRFWIGTFGCGSGNMIRSNLTKLLRIWSNIFILQLCKNIQNDTINLESVLHFLNAPEFDAGTKNKYFRGTPTKRQVSKRQVSKCPVSKRLKRQVYKTSGCKTSGLQNVRFTKRQIFKTSGCKKNIHMLRMRCLFHEVWDTTEYTE